MVFTGSQKLVLTNQALYSVYSALTFSFVIPFALVLGLSNTLVGFIFTVQSLAVMLSQLPGEHLIEWHGRKVVYLVAVPLSRLLWVGLVLLPFYFENSVVLFFLFFFGANFFQYFAEPAYVSLVSDVVPARIRGWFFGVKNNVQYVFDTAAFLIAGYYLDLFPKGSVTGFVNIMLVGLVFGIIAASLIGSLPESNRSKPRHHHFLDYFRIKGHLRHFILFVFFFNFAYGIASPFFTVYMLKDLALEYGTFALLSIVPVIVRLLVQPHFGRVSDRYGDRSLAWLMVFGTAAVPLLFFFIGPGQIGLLIFAQIVAGFVWAGVDLALFNMLLDLTSPRDRAFQTSAYMLFTSASIAIAPLVGGWMADHVTLGVAGIPLIFLLSTLLRAGTSFLLFLLPEVRAKKTYSLRTVLLSVFSFHPEKGLANGARFFLKHFR